MKKQIAVCLGIALLIAATGSVFGEEGTEAKLRIERVALFKNGVGYFTSAAVLPAGTKSITFGRLPVASLGTFWVAYPETLKVRGLFTALEDGAEIKPVRNLRQLLSANVGRIMTLRTYGKEGMSHRGMLVSAGDALPEEPASPYVMGPRGARQERYGARAPVLLMTEEGGTVALRADQIVQAEIHGEDVKTSFAMPVKRPSLRMELEAGAKGEKVQVNYLARGITWSPSYLVDLTDPQTARLTAKALVINEAADLDAVRIELVTGFPNLRFADINSPVAMSQQLSEFLKALQRGRREGRRDRSMMGQQVMSNTIGFAETTRAPVADYASARAGATAEDLFLYPVDRITLRRGETAYLPLFTAEVPYEHVYIWKIPDALDERERYRQQPRREERGPETEEVWHACRLTNKMKMPWTTAPAQFIKNGQITGQDICYYTASGTKTTIRINRAMNVFAE